MGRMQRCRKIQTGTDKVVRYGEMLCVEGPADCTHSDLKRNSGAVLDKQTALSAIIGSKKGGAQYKQRARQVQWCLVNCNSPVVRSLEHIQLQSLQVNGEPPKATTHPQLRRLWVMSHVNPTKRVFTRRALIKLFPEGNTSSRKL